MSNEKPVMDFNSAIKEIADKITDAVISKSEDNLSVTSDKTKEFLLTVDNSKNVKSYSVNNGKQTISIKLDSSKAKEVFGKRYNMDIPVWLFENRNDLKNIMAFNALIIKDVKHFVLKYL